MLAASSSDRARTLQVHILQGYASDAACAAGDAQPAILAGVCALRLPAGCQGAGAAPKALTKGQQGSSVC